MERSYPTHLLELLAVLHVLKALRPYLLEKPSELHMDNASLQWLLQQRHISHHQARWLNLRAEYQYRAAHTLGSPTPPTSSHGSASPTIQARRRARATTSPCACRLALGLFTASESGAAPASAFVAAGPAAEWPRLLHAEFAAAPISRPRFAQRSRLTRFVLVSVTQVQDRPPPAPRALRIARCAAPSFAATAALPPQPARRSPLRAGGGRAARAGAARAPRYTAERDRPRVAGSTSRSSGPLPPRRQLATSSRRCSATWG